MRLSGRLVELAAGGAGGCASRWSLAGGQRLSCWHLSARLRLRGPFDQSWLVWRLAAWAGVARRAKAVSSLNPALRKKPAAALVPRVRWITQAGGVAVIATSAAAILALDMTNERRFQRQVVSRNAWQNHLSKIFTFRKNISELCTPIDLLN